MKKFVGLLLCLSLSSFIVTRAAKPTHGPRSQKEINSQELYAKSASFNMSDAEQDQVAADQDDQQAGSGDDNNNQNASGDKGADDQQGGAADAGEQDASDDAEAVDTGTDDADDGGGE